MNNKWFENVFLASIFEKTGAGKSKWLSQKQTAVCTQYMECHTERVTHEYGEIWNHSYYTYTWGDREVTLNYSKKNGCGIIEFGCSQEEKKQNAIRNAEKQREHERERAERTFIKRPEKYKQHIESLENDIADLKEEIADALERKYSQWEITVTNCEAAIEETKEKLKIWRSVAQKI